MGHMPGLFAELERAGKPVILLGDKDIVKRYVGKHATFGEMEDWEDRPAQRNPEPGKRSSASEEGLHESLNGVA
jgi:hypothetical protein